MDRACKGKARVSTCTLFHKALQSRMELVVGTGEGWPGNRGPTTLSGPRILNLTLPSDHESTFVIIEGENIFRLASC